ncbi:MAG: hypothetical protein A2845_06045 [Candidatus Lloydbacteria bacterium RIFCSPHIGHO2_01_FULL_49_22]|uniref:Uncharacterized protein n=1 Tax=Candidatus Lloydbacteria bacterium RIFCSPHIGHO2_01_FULL_49_22 TaxID=1798658 RepID=A0A1G2D0N8_9BACT|nr:MAG: hypothetical protein A2845_06045 [Candidatus Lloydbacteria bacterium RIFCSPHIGHO2_01_FULL_49_22]OGZ08805.1 MAG: hypothetical protein A3C14_01055 [Candidatus Lloydbacteria bacterium RIFCSPHIGHO2_02_FULL_50_18]
MPLSEKKLKIYQKYYQSQLRPIREFDNGNGHPVVMMSECHAGAPRKNNSWMHLMCPCDLKWKWEMFGTPKKRTMVMTGDGFHCAAQEDAREVVRNEIQRKYQEVWATMSLADRANDIWQKFCAGEYMGEHNVGSLYVQDIERLLGTTPDVLNVQVGAGRNAQGEIVSPPRVEHISCPSKAIRSAIFELKKRKLVDLNGMILVPYSESFRFPEELHRQFAYWIEVPLGWPNGEAGDCFMFTLYAKIVRVTNWKSGEDVFGPQNIPTMTAAWKESCITKWLPLLDHRLLGLPEDERHEVLTRIPLEEWIAWLLMIREEVLAAES